MIHFGVFDLDLSAHELRKRGIRVKLQEQPFQVLALLLERKGEVVTREELRAKLWPGDTFVDFDHGLGSAINKLREALGESAENPRFIETLPRRGYRFIAAVDLPVQEPTGPGAAGAEGPSPEATATAVAHKAPPSVRVRGALGAALTVTVVFAALVGFNIGGVRDRLLRKTRPAGIESIAVLPFVNLSSDPENEYFSDGLTEEIIQSLAVVEGLEVTSRTSSFALKGARLDIRDIGAKLNASVLLEGSVRRLGDQLRVTAQLIRAADGRHLWSNTYDREMHDVFAIQEGIADSIANALRLKLGAGPRHYTDNLQAYDLYLRGRYALEHRNPLGGLVRDALQYFEQAIGKDANYALAYAGAADAFMAMDADFQMPHSEAMARATAAAEKALELDPMLSEAHTALALVRVREYAWQEAERGFRRAIELNPNNSLAHLELGFAVLINQGRFDEGLAESRRAVALDPLSPLTREQFAGALLRTGRFEEAIDQARKAVALDPIGSSSLLGRALYSQGRTAEALATIQEVDRRATDGGSTGFLACAYVHAGQRDQALRLLENNLHGAYRKLSPARRVAHIYACLGDNDRAFESLEKAFAQHEPGLPAILLSPEFAGMRSDPRYAALRQKVGLAP